MARRLLRCPLILEQIPDGVVKNLDLRSACSKRTALLWQHRGVYCKNEELAPISNAPAVGESRGEIAGDPSSRGSGRAAGVVFWHWFKPQSIVN
jgi:hypothetical protein